MTDHPSQQAESGGTVNMPFSADPTMTLCATVQDVAHDYVMDGGSPEDEFLISGHCAVCSQCAAYFDSLQRTATMLAFTVPMRNPSFSAKASLFARVGHSTTVSDQSIFSGSFPDFASTTLPSASAVPVAVEEARATRSRWQSFALPLATLPLLLALGIVGMWGLSAHMNLNDSEESVDLLNARVQLLRQEITDNGADLASIDTILQQPNTKQYSMYAQSESSVGNGMIWADPKGSHVALFLSDLDPEVGIYDVVLTAANGNSSVVDQIIVNDQGSSMKLVDLGRPLSECESLSIRPNYLGNPSDSQIANGTANVLYAPIVHGLNNVVDTVPGSQSGG